MAGKYAGMKGSRTTSHKHGKHTHPRPAIVTGVASTVKCNFRKVAKKHTSRQDKKHIMVEGSTTVKVENKPWVRKGDRDNAKSPLSTQCSTNVKVGG